MPNPYLLMRTALFDRLNEIPNLHVGLEIDPETQFRESVAVCISNSQGVPYANGVGTDSLSRPNPWTQEIITFELNLRYLTVTQDESAWDMVENIVEKVAGYQPYTGMIANTNQAVSAFYINEIDMKEADENGIVEGTITLQAWFLRLNGLPPRFYPNG